MHSLIRTILSTINKSKSLAKKTDLEECVQYDFKNISFNSYHDHTFNRLRIFLNIKDLKVENGYYYNPNIKGNNTPLIFYTADFKYCIKVINVNEFRTLLKITEDYATYVVCNPTTFLVKILACYSIMHNNEKVDFIIMKNIFETLSICDIFDLKGHRLIRKQDQLIKKENNWIEENYTIVSKSIDMISQINKDCIFLRKHDIMDYSLVISINNRIQNKYFMDANLHGVRKLYEIVELLDGQYSLGITDILTTFDIRKQFEFLFNLVCCRDNKSCKTEVGYYFKFMDMVRRTVVYEHDKERYHRFDPRCDME